MTHDHMESVHNVQDLYTKLACLEEVERKHMKVARVTQPKRYNPPTKKNIFFCSKLRTLAYHCDASVLRAGLSKYAGVVRSTLAGSANANVVR